MKINQFGRSMIEMLGVLAIIGVLSAAGLAGYSKAMYQYKVTKMIQEIHQIVINTQTLFKGNGYQGLGISQCMNNFGEYDGGNFDILNQSHIMPEEMIVNDHFEHPFKGSVCVGQRVGSDDHNSDFFTIWIRGLSNKLCIEIASQNWGNASTGFVGWTLNDRPDGDNADLFYCYNEQDESCYQNDIQSLTRRCQCTVEGCEIMLGFK